MCVYYETFKRKKREDFYCCKFNIYDQPKIIS